ncbi:MAG: ribosome recycling factor [Bdellovibrionaceae bacterium]|nr:ribosome recycling factor [Pseudobdellovibrionaceae bacterium]
MLSDVKTRAQAQMTKAIDALQNELKKVRTGRAQVSMLDNIKVNYYGNATPLNQVAAISCPDAKSFLIAPWEASVLKEIEQSIVKSDIGMTPMNDGKVIRLKVPDLTEERRKDLVKQVKKIVEETRVAVRMARRDANEEVKKALKDKLTSEDEAKKLETDIQKMTDDNIKKVDGIAEEKEKSILTL